MKALRDSLHHIDERVVQHFSQVGGSVLGDVSWYYRRTVDEDERIFVVLPGINRHPKENYTIQTNPSITVTPAHGVYGLTLQYVSRQYTPNTSRHNWPHVTTYIVIDNAIAVINQLIIFLVDKYSHQVEQVGNSYTVVSMSLPRYYSSPLKDLNQQPRTGT